ncbi:hypothetical protein D3C72_562970 [compost metagenome]
MFCDSKCPSRQPICHCCIARNVRCSSSATNSSRWSLSVSHALRICSILCRTRVNGWSRSLKALPKPRRRTRSELWFTRRRASRQLRQTRCLRCLNCRKSRWRCAVRQKKRAARLKGLLRVSPIAQLSSLHSGGGSFIRRSRSFRRLRTAGQESHRYGWFRPCWIAISIACNNSQRPPHCSRWKQEC